MANKFRIETIGQAVREDPRTKKNVEAFRSILGLVESIKPAENPDDHGKISESDLAELQAICNKRRSG